MLDRQAVWFTLPWPPSGNHAKAVVRGRMVKTKAAREWARAAAVIARSQGIALPFPKDARLEAEFTFYADAKRRSDLDNLQKSLQDAMKGVAWHDDRQLWKVTALRVRRVPADPEVAVVVRIHVPKERE